MKQGKTKGKNVRDLAARTLNSRQAKRVKAGFLGNLMKKAAEPFRNLRPLGEREMGGIWVQRKLEPASPNLISEITLPVVKWEKR